MAEIDFQKAYSTAQNIEKSVCSIMEGQETVIRRVLCGMVSGGHVLLEDYPGTGKTTLAKAIAGSVQNSDFSRVQFTPDLLPSDIIGVSILDPSNGRMRFQRGPVFTDILLADEVNRASPRTQSALLESMAERQVTIEGASHDLSSGFFVIATQNPVEFRGTYPLPEAQMDRFALQCSLGYVSPEKEVAILHAQRHQHPLRSMTPAVSADELTILRDCVREVTVSDAVQHYIVALVSATRGAKDVQLPASPRASLSLMRVAQAMSIFEGRDFVLPETVQKMAIDTIAHRLVIEPEAKFSGVTGRSVVERILSEVKAPV